MSEFIGARELSLNEVKLIMPTYERIEEQIESIRKSVPLNKKSTEEKIYSKVNSIGILGCRGAGKTSVMKTIEKELKDYNRDNKIPKNIILPTIVPDNMSDASSTMAVILGQFKNIVNKLLSNSNKSSYECDYAKDDKDLEKSYETMIRYFSIIQKEYREILINDFKNQKEYLEKSSDIFNADSRFITSFNYFIDKLVEYKKNEDDETRMIFLFIDDIDLSTHRSSDVTKTLLSYLAHPNIITVISGDLDTLEEALSIDLLRKEGALSSLVWEGQFLGSSIEKKDNSKDKCTKLISRKKSLAYEYLKKILPPAYRHNIIHWSLDKRHNYIIDSGNSSKSLGELLKKTLKELNPNFPLAYFGKVNENVYLKHTYHLFDDTSRGLNNVYNILSNVLYRMENNLIENNKNETIYQYKKILVETIVASKLIFSNNREDILTKIIVFGSNEETTSIRFDNLNSLLEKNFSPEEKFQMFILVDFTAKLLNRNLNNNDLNTESYEELKKMIVQLVINNPIISGSSLSEKKYIEKYDNVTGNKIFLLNKDMYKNINYNSIISFFNHTFIEFLFDSELTYFLMLYNHLTENGYDILSVEDIKHNNVKNLIYSTYRAYESIAINEIYNNEIDSNEKSIKKLIQFDLSKYPTAFYKCIENLSDKPQRELVETALNYKVFPAGKCIIDLIDGIYSFPYDNDVKEIMSLNHNYSEDYYKNKADDILKKLLKNTIYNLLKDDLFEGGKLKKNRPNYSDKRIPKLLVMDVINNKIINSDKTISWKHDLSEPIRKHLVVVIENITNEKLKEFNEKLINIKSFKDVEFEDFKDIYKGTTGTIAYNTELNMNSIIERYKENTKIKINDWFRLYSYADKLANNNRVWYGQYGAMKMRNKLLELSIEDIELELKEKDYFFFFINYVLSNFDSEKEYMIGETLSRYKRYILEAMENREINEINDFEGSIYNELEKELEKEVFDKLLGVSEKFSIEEIFAK